MRIGIYDSDKCWCEQIKAIVEDYAKQILFDVKVHTFGKKTEIMNHGTSVSFPDVLFLSMDEDGTNAIDIAKEINEKSKECQVVFYSDNLKYVTEVYSTVHTYFVLKDQLEERIGEIFHKIFEKQREKKKRHIFSVIGGKKVVLSSEEIIYFERVKRTTRVVSSFGTYEIRDKLDDLITSLPQQDFFRCHNSYIVYLPAVREVSKGNFVMCNHDTVAISRSYLKAVKELFG